MAALIRRGAWTVSAAAVRARAVAPASARLQPRLQRLAATATPNADTAAAPAAAAAAAAAGKEAERARQAQAARAAAVHTRLDKMVKGNDLVVLMKGVPDQPMCGFSRAVIQVLRTQGVTELAHINVLEDDDVRRYAKDYSSWPTFPQVYVKGEFVGGCDIIVEMFKSGELEKLLRDKGVPLAL